MKIGPLTLSHPVALAPMAGMTDTAFRRLVKRRGGCGLVVSEMVSSEGLVRGIDRTLEYAEYTEEERPVSIQIFGGDPQVMADAAQVVEGMGADIVDINMGCPVPKIAKHHAGCSLMRDPAHAASVVAAMARAVKIPVTVKMRAGWNDQEISAPRLARLVEDAGAAAVAVHGRTAAQSYSGESDWALIGRVASDLRIPVFGSGDCVEPGQVVSRLRETGVAGVLIGRGALRNPWIFSQAAAALNGGDPGIVALEDRGRFLLEYIELLLNEGEGEEADFRHAAPGTTPARPAARSRERWVVNKLRALGSWYTKGLDGGSQLRVRINSAESVGQLRDIVAEFFVTSPAVDFTPAGLPPNDPPPGASPEPFDTGRSLAGVSLLFVDDHAAVLEALRRLLTSEGADVEIAATGEDGLRMARDRAYDAIVLDLKLPRMSGVEVLHALRLDGVWTPVVILTGFPSVGSAFEAGRLGAVRYLQKPARLAEVVAAIRLAMEGRPSRRRSGRRLFRPTGLGRSDAAGRVIARLDAEDFASPTDVAPLLARLLAEQDLTLLEFIAGSRALRLIFGIGEANGPLASVVAQVRAWIAQAELRDARPPDPVAGRALFEMEAAGSDWSHLDEESVARLAGLPSASVWPLVEAEVGLAFVVCRRVFVMRRAVLDLAHGHEQVKQVAVHAGYEHVPNFNRDFQESFALPPTEFRRLFGSRPAL